MCSKTAVLSEELACIQRCWLGEANQDKREDIFVSEFFPKFAPLFERLKLHGDHAGMNKPQGLISILGLSWQPVVLMARWAAPERMLVIGTRESLEKRVADQAVRVLITKLSGVPLDRIDFRQVPDEGELEIYREVKNFLDSHNLQPKRVFIDPTGGKKTMSMAAALAGFVLGVPLVYVDYEKYDHEKRIPVAGTEYPRLVVNPLDELGDLEVKRIADAFNDGSYLVAEKLADALYKRLYESRQAEALRLVSKGYGDWQAFHFEEALSHLQTLRELLHRHASRGKWSWTDNVKAPLEEHIRILANLGQIKSKPQTIDEGMPLVLNHLATAKRHLSWGNFSATVMFLYATVERYVDMCLWVEFKLDDNSPDYASLPLNEKRFHEIGRRFFAEKYDVSRSLPSNLSYMAGIQLLATLKPERILEADLRPLLGLGNDRNKCEYEHGFLPKPPKKEKIRKYLELINNILSRELRGEDKLRLELDRYSFPKL